MIRTYLLFHIIAFVAGFFLDLLIGDPHRLIHPVQIIGYLISFLEKLFLKENDSDKKKFFKGVLTVLIVSILTLLVTTFLTFISYKIHIYLGLAVEAIMTYQILATKSLKVESMKVYKALTEKGLDEGRKAVSMIVGRDTENLSAEGVIKACVETVAENTSDGVIAPMLCTFIGGPVLGFLYKAINTMDSMIGYKNDKYMFFGRAAAKTDDLVNFIPSRISALLLIFSCNISGKDFSSRNAMKIFKRDRFNHTSPNSAQTEAACAGALGLKLAGDAYYFGKIVKKPYIGDELRKIETEDIKRINKLMVVTAYVCAIICTALMTTVYLLIK
ncbi:MAG: adenosylcobinamide-phosphate synthase CbiB [Lachnospiraceae bacterium]|nr:adenosylcobinamide-phosphate synthase CbiB [Lachnospiraceae bacterium]